MALDIIVPHTPGPWTRQPHQRFRHDQSAGVQAASGTYVAAALDLNNYDRDAEVEANARLIAAGPRLLRALGALVETIQALPAEKLPWIPRLADDMIEASQAIAEALGEARS